ncbi:MAG: NAD(P)H-dependent oxidoreductase [Acidaminobacteraceae bacterium]
MKQILCIIGSQRRKTTYLGVQTFKLYLNKILDIHIDYLFLNNYHLEFCHGCKRCFDHGENHCPIDDDLPMILEQIYKADGLVLASPNYAFHVSGRMKNFIDRVAYLYHRPRLFNVSMTAIVSQGVFGGNSILKYLESSGQNLGCQVVKGSAFTALEPLSHKNKDQMDKKMAQLAQRFAKSLQMDKPIKPNWFRFMMFRITRSGIQYHKTKLYDYEYFKKQGWFESDYYYSVPIGRIKKLLGHLFDYLGRTYVSKLIG